MQYRTIGIKGGDILPYSFFENVYNAILKGRYNESNWLQGLPYSTDPSDTDKDYGYNFPLHLITNKMMVFILKEIDYIKYLGGVNTLPYIQGRPYSIDLNALHSVTHTQAKSGLIVNKSMGYDRYFVYSYDIVKFNSEYGITNGDGVPLLRRINMEIKGSATINGTYADYVFGDLKTYVRFIEIGTGFDFSSLTLPIKNEKIPANLMDVYHCLTENMFTGLSNLPVNRYANYLIPNVGQIDAFKKRNRIRLEDNSMLNKILDNLDTYKTSSFTYSNVLMTPQCPTRLTYFPSVGNPETITNLVVGTKLTATHWQNSSDLVFGQNRISHCTGQFVIDVPLTALSYNTKQCLNLGLKNRFAGQDSNDLNEMMGFWNLPVNYSNFPICSSFISMFSNTLALPFWQSNNDCLLAGWDWEQTKIVQEPISMFFDINTASLVDVSEYVSGVDIADTVNDVYIRFF